MAPGGQWVAYISDESGQYEVYVDSFPVPGNRTLVSTGGGTLPIWHKNGTALSLYYIAANDDLMVSNLTLGQSTVQRSTPHRLFRSPVPGDTTERDDYGVLGDGERFVFNAALPDVVPRGVTVVTNWTSLAKE